MLEARRPAGACPARSVSAVLFTETNAAGAAPDAATGPSPTASRASVVPSAPVLPKGIERCPRHEGFNPVGPQRCGQRGPALREKSHARPLETLRSDGRGLLYKRPGRVSRQKAHGGLLPEAGRDGEKCGHNFKYRFTSRLVPFSSCCFIMSAGECSEKVLRGHLRAVRSVHVPGVRPRVARR